MDQAGARDRAGIDHRIERTVVVGQPDRVESIAARLDTDRSRNALLTNQLQRQREHEGLRYRLNRKRHGAVAGFIDMAIDGDETDAKMGSVSLFELRNVVG